jgi:cytochrome c oxidase subunit 4
MTPSAASMRPIILTWGSLLVLTLLSSLVGLMNLGTLNLAIAVLIAAIQASLIAFFLMHALHGPGLIRVVLAGGVIWFLILETLTWTDYVTRGWLLPSGK